VELQKCAVRDVELIIDEQVIWVAVDCIGGLALSPKAESIDRLKSTLLARSIGRTVQLNLKVSLFQG
jgi:hypothetical protein